MSTPRWVLFAAGLAALSTALTFGVDWIDQRLWEAQGRSPMQGLNNEITDLAFQSRSVTQLDSLVSTSEVVIVDIDEASIEKLGRVQRWPRSYDARVIDHVSAGNPAAIGVDLLYSEPDTLTPTHQQLLREAGFTRPDDILRALRTDKNLARSLRASGVAYLAAFDASRGQRSIGTQTGAVKASADSTGAPFLSVFPTIPVPSEATSGFLRLRRPVLPISPFRKAARGVAPVTLSGGRDGTIRNYPAGQVLSRRSASSPGADTSSPTEQTWAVPSFAVLMAAGALNVPADSIRVRRNSVALGSARKIPIAREGSFPINWLGENEQIQRISFYDILRERVPPAFFEDKYVFIGTSAAGLGDRYPTPVAERKPGVQIHAEAFLSVLNGAFPQVYTARSLWPAMLVGAFILSLLFLTLRPLFASVVALGLGLSQFFGYVLFFPSLVTILPVGTFLLLTLFTYGGSVVTRYLTEERERRHLEEAFASYVSPDVVEQILDKRESLKLGGEKREMTVLFCDVRGFTGLTERSGPENVVSLLNSHFDRMSQSILEEDGTIDKYIGDAIMAFFGAPLPQDDHAHRACRAALAMQELVHSTPTSSEEEYSIGVGVGISTGSMVVGNVGSSSRFDYTVIGDAVNLGARLEELSSILDISILVSENTVACCGSDTFHFRSLGPVAIKGRDKPAEIYELLSPKEYDDPASLCEQFEEGRALYQECRFADALSVFEACSRDVPEDKLSKYYARLCRRCLEDPKAYQEVLDLDTR